MRSPASRLEYEEQVLSHQGEPHPTRCETHLHTNTPSTSNMRQNEKHDKKTISQTDKPSQGNECKTENSTILTLDSSTISLLSLVSSLVNNETD